MVVDRRIQLAHDVVEHARCYGEDRSTIAALCGMTHAVRRIARKEDCLVHIGGDPAPSEMARERAVTHQDDVIYGRLFLGARSTLRNVTTIVVHADDRALVEWTKLQQVFIAG